MEQGVRVKLKGGVPVLVKALLQTSWVTGGNSSSLSGCQYLYKRQGLATLAPEFPGPGCNILPRTYMPLSFRVPIYKMGTLDQVTLAGPSESDHLGPLM